MTLVIILFVLIPISSSLISHDESVIHLHLIKALI